MTVNVIYTNPRHAAIALEHYRDVGAFEREAARRRGRSHA